MATGDNASLRAVAKQQRQCGDSGGGAWLAAEPHCLHMAGATRYSAFYLLITILVNHRVSKKTLHYILEQLRQI